MRETIDSNFDGTIKDSESSKRKFPASRLIEAIDLKVDSTVGVPSPSAEVSESNDFGDLSWLDERYSGIWCEPQNGCLLRKFPDFVGQKRKQAILDTLMEELLAAVSDDQRDLGVYCACRLFMNRQDSSIISEASALHGLTSPERFGLFSFLAGKTISNRRELVQFCKIQVLRNPAAIHVVTSFAQAHARGAI